MQAAIFGANGYIGSHLAQCLAAANRSVRLYDRHEKPFVPGLEYHKCDITDEGFWADFDAEKFSTVYFLAGLLGVEEGFRNASDFLKVNEGGLLNLLKRLEPLGSKSPKIIFPSSRLVYRGGGEVTEESPLEARSVYAASKIACESLLQAYRHRYGIPYVVLRIGVPYGELVGRDYSYGTISFFKRQAFAGKPITIYGEGQCAKTYTYIGDVCTLFMKVADSPLTEGVYNLGGHNYTLREVAETVASTYGGLVKSVPWPEPASRVEMGNITLNAAKLAEAVGFFEYQRMDCLSTLGVCL